MPDADPADAADHEQTNAPHARDKAAMGIGRRIRLAKELANHAVVAEMQGDHRAAAQRYKEAIDTLLTAAESAAANDPQPEGSRSDSAGPAPRRSYRRGAVGPEQ
jgi:hypothetical protein